MQLQYTYIYYLELRKSTIDDSIDRKKFFMIKKFKLLKFRLQIKEGKADLYSAFIAQVVLSKRSGMDHTVSPANYTMPALPS